MFDDIKQQLTELIERPLLREGCEIVDVVLSRYRSRWLLRLFVFSDRGTTIGECARISQIVGDILDGTDLLESGYILEVSSPGLDRPLKSPQDFRHRVGETVAIDFVDPKREKMKAEILAATETEVQVKNGTGLFTVGLEEIDKARIVF